MSHPPPLTSARHRLPVGRLIALLPALLLLADPLPAPAQVRMLEEGARWLRTGEVPEWTHSAAHPHEPELELRFSSDEENATEHTLSLRQSGVRREWSVVLNEREIGKLYPDENPHRMYLAVPPGTVRQGANVLRIAPLDSLPDDVEVAEILLHPRPRAEQLAAASLELTVSTDDGSPVPARVTVVDGDGALVELATSSGGMLAVRPGVVYTGDGRASLRLPAGEYVVYASRGFEYGVDSARVALAEGEAGAAAFRIRREVPTPGWVAADTHVHTGTHSGHGDATVEERVITLAAEGLELPILTDHNVHVDLAPTVRAMGMDGFFTPVVGNELTTPIGHFNLFPVPVSSPPPPHELADWGAVMDGIGALSGVRVIVLNHPRDIHRGFRPFGEGAEVELPAERAAQGSGSDGGAWELPANAMEIMNSGSQQRDPLGLFHDWLQLLGRGYRLTPVGSSDSHDVARYIPGQGRTYVRAPDDDPGNIDVAAAMESLREGGVMVSFGLMAELTVNGRYGPGEAVPAGEDELAVAIRVLGPSWARADRVSLYVDGRRVRSEPLADAGAAGVKWSGTWSIPRPRSGAYVVALAEGPDPRRAFWPIALPYQVTSPDVAPRVMGASGAVWIE